MRLHPTLKEELIKYGIWSHKDVDILADYIRKSENIVWDENPTYYEAYSVADAILVDGCCGMIYSALPLMKPIAIMYRNDYDFKPHEDLAENYYQVHNPTELNNFFDEVVLKENDYMYKYRKNVKDRYFKIFDGKNAKRIAEKILIEYKKFIAKD